ncbi:Por secretion system C-terminal sorting domain-containing protein [Tenacibaculum litopenaei]|uniref:T9SS type A sorting domain-containing protein n=1 Tax=Tenacibaculum litopenaei TaxID=396016 RepID=UPI00389577A8
MKKNYFFVLLLILCQATFGQATDLYISMYAEGSSNNKFIEIYNGTGANVDLSKYKVRGSNNGGDWKAERDVALTGTLNAGAVYVIATDAADATILAKADLKLAYESPVHYNGDDAIGLFKDNGSGAFTLIDVVGVPTTDPGTAWEVAGVANATKDHTLTRKATVCKPNADWAASAGTNAGDSEWIVTAKDSEWGSLGSFNGCSSTPSLSISSPTENQVVPYAATVTVKFNVTNFNVATGGTGDGYIKWKLNDVAQAAKYDTNDISINVTAGTSYKVYMELVDNSGNPLATAVNVTRNFTVNKPCDLVIGAIETTCDALTAGTDTFSGSIAFTGGNTGVTYTIKAQVGGSDVGTIGGDNPSTVASGKITFTGLTEGTDVKVTIVGDATSSCDFSRTLYSPTCTAFPIVETFDYAADSKLTDAALWQTTSTSTDKVKVVAATLGNPYQAAEFPNPTGNMVSFDGAGADPYLEFYQQKAGTVYVSFVFTAADITKLTNANGGYFAVLAEPGGSYKGRIWLKQDATDATKYKIGMSTGSSSASYTSTLHTPNEEVFLVVGFDFTSKELLLWENPAPASFAAASAPAATLKATATGNDIPSSLGRFLLRQDSTSETPSILFDELRIATSWKDVTPKGATASIDKNSIAGFAAYPNPVLDKEFALTTASSEAKKVEVFTVLGSKVHTEVVKGLTNRIDLHGLNAGIYLLKVTEGTKTATKKLVVK